MNSLEDVAAALARAGNVLICGHEMPDGDSLGSTLALGLVLHRLGKKVTTAGPDPVPEIYKDLPGADIFMAGSPPLREYDTMIVLDCSVPERLGRGYQELLSGDMVVINIDHHAGAKPFGSIVYSDIKAAAVGEIIFDLLELMQVEITVDVATWLYIAIITDTGSFQYDNTTSSTHRRVARLLDTGVPAAQLNIRLYEEKPLEAIILLGASLNTLSFDLSRKVSWMTISRENLQQAGARDEHTEGIVNYTRRIKGVEVGIVFREIADDRYKISFRSKENVDVNVLAALFGGGGHPRASGCVVHGEFESIKDEVIKAAITATGGVIT